MSDYTKMVEDQQSFILAQLSASPYCNKYNLTAFELYDVIYNCKSFKRKGKVYGYDVTRNTIVKL